MPSRKRASFDSLVEGIEIRVDPHPDRPYGRPKLDDFDGSQMLLGIQVIADAIKRRGGPAGGVPPERLKLDEQIRVLEECISGNKDAMAVMHAAKMYREMFASYHFAADDEYARKGLDQLLLMTMGAGVVLGRHELEYQASVADASERARLDTLRRATAARQAASGPILIAAFAFADANPATSHGELIRHVVGTTGKSTDWIRRKTASLFESRPGGRGEKRLKPDWRTAG